MKAKTFILTFLMMMSSTFLFGQNVLPGGYNMTITSEIILDGVPQTNTDYLVYAMHDGTVLGQSSIMKEGPDDYITVPLYYVNLEVEGNSGDVINFKLVADGKTYISSTEVDYEDNAMLGNLEDLWTIEFKTVAQIGDVVYPSLQKAIDAAANGDVVTLLKNNAENVTVVQAPNVAFTIEGAEKTMSGTITVNGKSAAYATAGLTIQNVNFDATNISKDASINLGDGKTTTRYTNGVTVQDCDFTGDDQTKVAIKNYTGGCKNLTVTGGTFTGLHSLMQVKGVENLAVSGVEVSGCKNGVSVGTSTNVAISSSQITATGYGVRADGTGAYDMTLNGANEIIADLPVVVRNTTGAYELKVESGTYTALNGNPAVTFTTGDDGTFVAPTSPATSDLADGISTFGFEAKIGTVYHTTFVNAYAAAAAGDVITLLKDQNFSEIITLDKAITLDGGNYKLTSTAGRAINVDCAGEVTIKNLTIVGSTGCERGINIIDQAGITNIENVTISGQSHYAVHMATSAGAATVNVKNSNLTGYGAFVVYGKGSVNTIENSTLVGINTYDDNGSNNFGTIVADVENTTITVTGGNITAKAEEGKAGMAIFTGKNGNNANVTLNSTLALEGAAKYIEILNETTTLKVKGEYATAIQAEGFATSDPDNGLVKVEGVAVAKIGETKYATLAKAITAAQANDVIVLLADITENVTVNKNVTIDGDEFAYTGTMEGNAGLTITIQNVNFVGGGFAKNTKSATGTYTFKNCTFEDDGDYAYAFIFKGASSVTIEDCTVKNYLYSFLYITSGTNKVSVKNVTVEDCQSYAVYFASGVNTATIENLTVKNSNNGFVINNTANRALTLKNCKLENVTNAINHANGTNTITCTLLGNQNDFGTSATSQYAKYVLAESTATLTAPEGLNVTTSDPEYVVVYENGAYIVKAGNVLNANTDVKYATLADAITAATAGNTLVLLADITENVTVSKNLTIDGANDDAVGGKFDYTGTMTANAGLTVTVQNIDFVGGGFDKSTKSTSGNYTIKNCTFEDDGDYAYPVRIKGANSVTIEDCTVKNYLYSFLYITSGTNSVSVKNVTVEDCPNYAVYFASGVNSAIIENLTVKNSDNGFVINNTANRALTLKNCKLENVLNAINHSNGTNTITCTLLGNENNFGTSVSNQYAKYVLAAADATLTAPEGYTVTTTVENSLVKYVDGAYKVVPAVAKIGDVCYETLADAIAAIGAGDVVIELLDNASLDITAWQTLAIGGDNTTSITIDGDNGEEDFTLTFNKLNSDWNHVATSNGNTTKLILENLKLADSGYNNGPWNRYDIVFASDVELTNVVSAKALAFKANATLNNVTINESGDNYAIWIQPNEQSVTIDGLVINSAGRGIKVDEQYVTAQNVSLSVANATFTTAKKAAIIVKSSAETTITVGEDVNIANVAADQTNIAWVDEDASAHYGKVTVTGGTLTQENLPVFVAALMNDAKVEGYYKVFEEALAAAANEKILVLKTVVLDTDKVIDFEGKEVNSNVHPVFRITNGATVTVKNGNMNTAKGYNFILGASDESSAGNLTIESGKFHGAITVASVTMGSLNITGGEFSVEPYQGSYEFLINCIDANYNNGAEVSISGGIFHKWNPENNAAEGVNTNFCAPGHVAVYDAVNDTYTVIEADYVAQIGEVKYISLQAAIDAAENGDKIVVLENINIADVELQKLDVKYNTYFKVEGKAVTIDLKGKTISGEYASSPMLVGVFSTDNNGHLTLEDSSDEKTGAVNVTTAEGYTVYSLIANYEPGCSITINGGTYTLDKASDSHIYSGSTSGETEGVIVNGGVFKLGNVGTGTNGKPWMFNVLGSNDGNVVVKGGTFDADINHQFWAKEVYVPETLALQNNGNGTWTVVESVAYVEETATSTGSTARKVGYATIEDAIEAIGIRDTNETVTMLKDVVLENTITIAAGKEVILDLNGKTISGVCNSGQGHMFMVQNTADLTVKDSSENKNGKITYAKGTSNTGWVIDLEGDLILESGTIELTGDSWSIGYAVDVRPNSWGSEYTEATTFTMKGGKLVSSDAAVRVASSSADDHENVSANFIMNGGEIEAAWDGIFVQQSNAAYDILNVRINGGNIKSALSPLRLYGPAATSVLNNVENPITLNITGGTFDYTGNDLGNEKWLVRGVIMVSGGATFEQMLDYTDFEITGGTFDGDVNDYCAEGFAAVNNDDGTWEVMPAQEQTLPSGWSWYSTYLKIGLSDLTNAIGDNGVQIKNQEGIFKQYNDNLGYWSGSLSEIDLRDMYMVNVKADQTLKVAAPLAVTEEYTITIYPGWNWIGYPSNVNVDINTVLKELTPEKNDLIKTQHKGYAQFNYNKWRGGLNTMLPGEGYMYYSNATTTKTFVYTVEATRGTVEANVTAENNYWTPDATKYPFNMTMTAVVDGLTAANYEVAAFVNGEVRGSARPIYIEEIDAYVLFLTIHGEDVEEMSFRLYDIDNDTEYDLSDRINYSNDAHLGSVNEPYVFSRGTTGIGEASMSNINIYPNPTTTGTEINLQSTCDTVEVFNALGVKVAEYQNVDTIDALETAGIYVIRITNDGNVQNCRLVVK